MPYFIIFPALAIYKVAGLAVVIGCSMVSGMRPMLPFAWRILLWSVVGTTCANVLFLLGMVWLAQQHADIASLTTVPRAGATILLGGTIFVGLFIVSGVGITLGGIVGVLLATRRRFRAER